MACDRIILDDPQPEPCRLSYAELMAERRRLIASCPPGAIMIFAKLHRDSE